MSSVLTFWNFIVAFLQSAFSFNIFYLDLGFEGFTVLTLLTVGGLSTYLILAIANWIIK